MASDARQRAIDETKARGNPTAAIALAIVYLADTIAALAPPKVRG